MDEADAFAQDRRRYHLHAITFFVGLGGLSGSTALTAVIDARVAMWFAAVFAAVLAVSGALAITVKRTVFSKRAQDTDGLDVDGDPGDAITTPGLWSGDVWPWFTNATAPWAVLVAGVGFFGFFVWWALH